MLFSFLFPAVLGCSGGGGESDEPDSVQRNFVYEGGTAGYYKITTTPTTESNIHTNVTCTGNDGQIAIFRDELTGWAGNLNLVASLTYDGLVNGAYTSEDIGIGTITGHINGRTGNGRWEDIDGTCNGSWAAERLYFPTLQDDGGFIVSSEVFPAALRIRFTPVNRQLFCNVMTGMIKTNGKLELGTLIYEGIASGGRGYEKVIQLKLYTVSGDVEGRFSGKEGFLGEELLGGFSGDLYFSDSERIFEYYRIPARVDGLECKGVWSVIAVDASFAEVPY